MWGNNIGDEGAEAFAEALRYHPSLTNLRWEDKKKKNKTTDLNNLLVKLNLFSSLSANGITSTGGKLLAEALKENNVLRIFW